MRSENRLTSVVLRHLPAVAVVAVLAGLGVYGHQSQWKLPEFSALGSVPNEPDAWCPSHGVPEPLCVECRSGLLPRGPDYGWCREHGVQNCPLCHPDASQLDAPQATAEAEHALASAASAAPSGAENNPICKNYRRRIQLASSETAQEAGLDVAIVDRRPISDAISIAGEITYDETRFASLSSRLPGTVWRVTCNVGDRVRRGDVLALVDAADVGQTKAQLLRALAEEEYQRQTQQRIASLSSDGVVAGRQAQAADAALRQSQASLLEASQTLANLGLPVDIEPLRELSPEERAGRLRLLGLPDTLRSPGQSKQATANLLPLVSPIDGLVVKRKAVAGEVVDESCVLFQIADVSRMWLRLNVSLEDAIKLAVGQTVAFLPDGSRQEATGKLFWISTQVDRQTRTIAALAEVPNPAGHLRHETFGTGRVVVREAPQAIVIPNESLHWDGCCHVVFIRDKAYFDSPDSPKAFHVRVVRPGTRAGESTEIIAGVLPGEIVAASGSDILRAQLLRNNLGEGCCAE